VTDVREERWSRCHEEDGMNVTLTITFRGNIVKIYSTGGKSTRNYCREQRRSFAMKKTIYFLVSILTAFLLGRYDVFSVFAEEPEIVWPIYHELALDEVRGVIYASDPVGHKIDIITIANLSVQTTFTTNNFVPRGIALSPDGQILAVANYGINDYGNLVFFNATTGAVVKKISPSVDGINKPWDVVYSGSGYLYSSGNPGVYGGDYVHAINVTTYQEVNKSVEMIRGEPYLAISADNSFLYADEPDMSPQKIYKYDISSGGLSYVDESGHADFLKGKNFLLSPDGKNIYMDSGQVWRTGLSGRSGSTGQSGNITLIPSENAIAITIDNATGNDAIAFYNSSNYYGIKKHTLTDLGTLGPIVALSDGSKLIVTSSSGLVSIDLTSGLPGTNIPRPPSALPYFELVIDEARGVMYGSDSDAHKIDVISLATLDVERSIRLPNGTMPKGMALSPDGSELAVAEYGGSAIVFLNPLNGVVIATVVPENDTLNMPWDVIYGRAGRLYSTGNTNYDGHFSLGFDYIHVIDTSTHTEIGKSTDIIRNYPMLAISSDKNSLFVNLSDNNQLYKFDISTDVLQNPTSLPSVDIIANNFILSADNTKIFTDSGQVWDSGLHGQIGSTEQSGVLTELPIHNALAVGQDNPAIDAVVFYKTSDYYGITKYSLPALGTLGPMVAKADGSRLYISHSTGIYQVDLSGGLPGVAIPPLVGSKPYFDLELDEARGVMYGSDPVGHRIDVISIGTGIVVDRFRLVNGAYPTGIDLSPDGSELAVAEYGASKIVFLDPATGDVLFEVMPNTGSSIYPWDVAYGRAGRLYSTGNPYSYGMDYLHVIDTTTHTEVGRSIWDVRAYPTLAVSPDGNSIYVNDVWLDHVIRKFDVTTDLPTLLSRTPNTQVESSQYILLPNGKNIFTNYGQVWDPDLIGPVGSTGQSGRVLYVPTLNAIAVLQDKAANEVISFYNATTYYGIKTNTLDSMGKLGPMVAASDGSAIYISSSKGIKTIDLSGGFPGSPIPLPKGSQPYADLIIDEARGVLYGSDTTGHKIDVISMSTLKVIKRFRLVNGASPRGIALSPDGSELAIAENGASAIAFINPLNGKLLGRVMPNTDSSNLPWDVIYGRDGRLYSSGSPRSYGHDYIHVIDTVSHLEISRSNYKINFFPDLAISSDGNLLYVVEGVEVGNRLYRFNVSTDTLPKPVIRDMNLITYFEDSTILLKKDNTKLFASVGQVWNAGISKKLGTFTPTGKLAEIPSQKAFLSAKGNKITYFNSGTFAQIGETTLTGVSKSGPVVLKSDDSVLFITTNTGVKKVDLTSFPPDKSSQVSINWPLSDFFDLILMSLNQQIKLTLFAVR